MTPQGQVGGAPEQSWFKKNWMWLAGAGCAVPLFCCGATMLVGLVMDAPPTDSVVKVADPAAARVDCGTPGPNGVDCDIKRTGGGSAFRACWQLDITCNNDGVMSGNACGEVEASATGATVNMPVDGFSNQEGCDAPKSGAVKNLEVTAR
ncbi:MAG: hypothetical protein ACO1OB_23855 [Archangium sp.]